MWASYQDLSRHKVDECWEKESSHTCGEDGIEVLETRMKRDARELQHPSSLQRLEGPERF